MSNRMCISTSQHIQKKEANRSAIATDNLGKEINMQNEEKKLLLVSAHFEDYPDGEYFIYKVPASRLGDARKAIQTAELKWHSAKLEDVFEISDYIAKEFVKAGIPFEEMLFDEMAVEAN